MLHKLSIALFGVTTALLLGTSPNAQAATFSLFDNIFQNATMNSPNSSSGPCMSMQQSLGGLNQSLSMCAPGQIGPTVTVISRPSGINTVINTAGGTSITNLNNLSSIQISNQTSNTNTINTVSTISSTSNKTSQSGIQTVSQIGRTQTNPILPSLINNRVFSFTNVLSRMWVDPPTAYGFNYTMTGNSLFTDILDFPTGFKTPFTVAVKDIILGNFTAGQSVNFNNYSSQLGNLLTGNVGVSQFSVTGLNVDPTNPTAFPIQLGFSTETASFDQEAIEDVPEPLTCFGGLLGLGAMVLERKRAAKKP